MVVLAQLVERQIVALEVKGSTPLDHPTYIFGEEKIISLRVFFLTQGSRVQHCSL